MSCNWLQRWTHRRLRKADKRLVYPELTCQAVLRWTRDGSSGDPADYVDKAWAFFRAQPGQEHWRCACSTEEAA